VDNQPALILGIENVTGSIAVGKSADFLILNQDIHEISLEAISETTPLETWFRGQKVFAVEK
jgi:predicted amidohydrolase YtcJ